MNSDELHNVLKMLPGSDAGFIVNQNPQEVLVKTPFGTFRIERNEWNSEAKTLTLVTEATKIGNAEDHPPDYLDPGICFKGRRKQ